MTMTQLQYFIMAAQTMNFTTAAERLFTTQPALSRQIAALEQELDARLFVRANNVLELTEVGAFFYEKARKLYEEYQTALRETRDRNTGVEGRIRIGLLEDQLMDGRLTGAIHRLMQAHPRASIDIERHSYRDLAERLDQGRLDIAQTTIYEGLMHSAYQLLPLSEEPLCLAVNRTYITTEREAICLKDVTDIVGPYPMVVASPTMYPEVLQSCLPNMDMPNVRYVDTISSIPLYLTTGIAASVANGSNLLRADPDIRLIPIEDAPPVVQGVIWSSSNTNPLLKKLLDLLE